MCSYAMQCLYPLTMNEAIQLYRWCAWISILLSIASTPVLINGVVGPPIWHCRGLREGDPLSGMLSVIVIDILNSLLQWAISLGIHQLLTPRHMASTVSLYAMTWLFSTTQTLKT